MKDFFRKGFMRAVLIPRPERIQALLPSRPLVMRAPMRHNLLP
jgi:hypothetical protein